MKKLDKLTNSAVQNMISHGVNGGEMCSRASFGRRDGWCRNGNATDCVIEQSDTIEDGPGGGGHPCFHDY